MKTYKAISCKLVADLHHKIQADFDIIKYHLIHTETCTILVSFSRASPLSKI